MKIYLSGAITNDSDYKKKFDEAEKYLTSRGYEVFNPASFEDDSFKWSDYMKKDIKELLNCDAVAFVDNLKIESSGRDLEWHIAAKLNYDVRLYRDFL